MTRAGAMPGSPADHEADRRDLRICRMLDRGMTRREAAEASGMSKGHVGRISRELAAVDAWQPVGEVAARVVEGARRGR